MKVYAQDGKEYIKEERLSFGPESERPVNPIDGHLRYNTDISQYEVYNLLATVWTSVSSGIGWNDNLLYKINEVVSYDGILYKSLIDDNSDEPTVTANWRDSWFSILDDINCL